MSYQKKYFDPSQTVAVEPREVTALGDPDDGVYDFTDDVTLAVNVAFAVRRPLLVEGSPGTGKSTLAKNIARLKNYSFLSRVITSRTSAQDLLWEFDALQRLNDAQAGRGLATRESYVLPGVLWWAFDREGAASYGVPDGKLRPLPGRERTGNGLVVLLDEIDKADPGVPNDLLEALGNGRFAVRETGHAVLAKGHSETLLVLTTNGERDLAPAFVRRCIRLRLRQPDEERLARIGKLHFPTVEHRLLEAIAGWVVKERTRLEARRERGPSTAEFLDAVRACTTLGISPVSDDKIWTQVIGATLTKSDVESPTSSGAF